ncbi:hypothetical protein [Haloferula rosea]|uniref:Uncharacterized protein n=1 Tax=Haloferula rosea TaxID=490093 RepID=A0A934RFZ8_9BACT|nr:hypothetical protein [Haloferula rosea]MBK1827826.1 hypothetical protein [Haloferula rosea]
MRYLASLLFTAAILFSIQGYALWRADGRPGKNESNFFSSIGRIQAGIKIEPRVMLLGSSLTGRLPDESNGFEGVANLGCDGGSAADALRAIDRGRLPGAPLLIVEGNTLYKSAGAPPSEVAKALDGVWFSMGRRFPLLSAAARPSAFFYSALLESRVGAFDTTESMPLPVVSSPVVPVSSADLDPDEVELVLELVDVISRLKVRGMVVEIVILPPGAPEGAPNVEVPRALARTADVRFWDLSRGLPEGAVKLTDGVHMDRESATATLRCLLAEFESSPGQAR